MHSNSYYVIRNVVRFAFVAAVTSSIAVLAATFLWMVRP